MERSPLKVSIDEFLNNHEPKGKRSVLEPFAGDIEKLVARGYSLDQVVDWLRQNGVTITRSAISQFRGRSAERLKSAPAATASSNSLVSPAPRFESTGGNTLIEKRNATSPDPSNTRQTVNGDAVFRES